MADDKNKFDANEFDAKLSSIRTGIMEHYGNSDAFLYEFAVAVENEMEDFKPSQCDEFIKLAKQKGYVPSKTLEGSAIEHSEDIFHE